MGKVKLHYHDENGEGIISINPSDTVFLKLSGDHLNIAINGYAVSVGNVHESTPALQKIALLEEMDKILDTIDIAGTSEKTFDVYVRQDDNKDFGKSIAELKREEKNRFENAFVDIANDIVKRHNYNRFEAAIEGTDTQAIVEEMKYFIRDDFGYSKENHTESYAEALMGEKAPSYGSERKAYLSKAILTIENEFSNNAELAERVCEAIKEAVAREKEAYEQEKAQKFTSLLEATADSLFDVAKKADAPIEFAEGTRFYISMSTNGIRQSDMEMLINRFAEHELSKMKRDDAKLDYHDIFKLSDSQKISSSLTQATLIWAVNEAEQRTALFSLSTASGHSFGEDAQFVKKLGGNAENGYTIPIDMKAFNDFGDDFIEISRDEVDVLMEKRAEYAATLMKAVFETYDLTEVPSDFVEAVEHYTNFGFIKPEEITQMVQEICSAEQGSTVADDQRFKNGDEMKGKILAIVSDHPTVKEVQQMAENKKVKSNIELD